MTQGELPLDASVPLREERFAHRGFTADILLPLSAEALIDEAEFEGDERLPYWAELWPSARALAAFLLEDTPPPGPVIELGCGLGLPSLALRARGVDVLATDYYADALAFATHNAARNRMGPLPTRLLDWRHPPEDIGRFATIIAADVLYEARKVEPLRRLLPELLLPGGSLILADPGRVHLHAFRAQLEDDGWITEDHGQRREAAPAGKGRIVTVSILRFRRTAAQRPPPKL